MFRIREKTRKLNVHKCRKYESSFRINFITLSILPATLATKLNSCDSCYQVSLFREDLNPEFKEFGSLCKNLMEDLSNQASKFGNEFCIPAGPLREPVNQGLISIDAIVLTGNNNKDIDFNNIHNKTVFNSKVKTIKPPKIKNEKLLAFCGLANSNKFYETLKENGFNITSTKSFPDHYEYKNEDIDKLISEANKQNLKLITTEKDYVKIKDNKNLINTLPIEMELELKDKAVLSSFLQEKLNG